MTRLLLAALLVLLAGCSTPAAGTAGGESAGGPVSPPAPTALRIPALQAASTLVATGLLPDGTPQVPPVTEPGQASWADWSLEPGQVGPAVLLGHVDGLVDGRAGTPGVFARIDELTPGALIQVDLAGGRTVTFTVDRVERFPKLEFTDRASRATALVYGDVDRPELRLITCGGAFDRTTGSYRDQVVVFAHLTATP